MNTGGDRSITWTLLAALLLQPVTASAAAGTEPVGEKMEAESKRASDSEVVDDADASGGQAVSNGKAWQPLVSVAAPAEGGDRLTVHVRHRGGPLLMKAVMDGKQVDRKSIFAKPEAWTWSSFGTFDRADLGSAVVIIRGAGDAPVAVDAVVFAPATGEKSATPKPQAAVPGVDGPALPAEAMEKSTEKTMPPAAPDASLAPVTFSATINWNEVVAKAQPTIWGVADYEIKGPKSAANEGYRSFLTKLNSPFIRIHHASLPMAWMTEDEKSWDVEKIKASWAAAGPAYGDAKLMLNLASWPKWMSREDGTLDIQHADAYAQLYVELMRIMRDDVGRKVDFWEITNERDGLYEKRERLPELWQLYNTVAAAIKKEDPNAQTGGPAFTWAKPQWVDGFLKECAPLADFVTYHNYGIGDSYDSNEKLYGTLNTIERHARFMRTAVDRSAPEGKHIPIFLDEYNVKWVWNPIEPRHANSVGAAFQAAVVRRVALAGIDGANVWHVKGNAYGLIDAENVERPTSAMFLWGPQHLVGDIAAANVSFATDADAQAVANADDAEQSPSAPDLVELLPVTGEDGRRALLVISKAPRTIVLQSATSLLGGAPSTVKRVDADGIHDQVELDADAPLTVPGYSLTLLSARS
ncbi:MAG TPA: hypothetical protein VGN72_04765 [Tepidisphaeraceae bacterium]|jgi:xylan 1,4-beta-xylosidase|nr:hypothetical protein [Tepidisphaeraceae bacterium]